MKNAFALVLLTLTFSTFSQTILLDEKFTSGIPVTWSTINEDGNTPGVVQFTDAWIGYTTVFDTCAASTSYYLDANGDEDTSAVASDYLITSQVSLLTFGNLLTWDAKSLDGSFPDGYLVLISSTDNAAASFTDTLKIVDAETPYWTAYTINLMTAGNGYANQDVYIAFKNNTNNGHVLQLDNIKITGDDPASIDQKDVTISIYPNPVMNLLNVKVKGLESVKIFNLHGEIVVETTKSEIDVAYLPKGIYIVEVKTLYGIIQKKLVKA